MVSSRHTVSSDVDTPLFSYATSSVEMPKFISQAAISPQRDSVRKDVFNGRLLKGLTLARPYQIPKIDPCLAIPEKLISFTEALALHVPDSGLWVHFYEDDWKFERLWRHPEKYFKHLANFSGIISPDFSLYANMPVAQQIGNTYRNQLLRAYAQHQGLPVIANVRLNGVRSIPYALAGIPTRSSIAMGLHGCTKERNNRNRVIEELQIVCDFLHPANVLIYGSEAYGVTAPALQQGIPVHVYTPDSWTRSYGRTAA